MGAIAAYTGMSNTIAAATVAGMAITYAVGIASAAALGAVSALLSGGDIVEAMTNAVADAIFWGGVFAFISAGINALKTVARTTYNAKLPGSSQTGAQPQSTVNQCFKEGTLVETEEGLKPIEEIAVGDKVLAFDETTGEQAYKPVVQLFRNTTKEWYHIHVNGEEIICTGGHPFYVLNAEAERHNVKYEGQFQNAKGTWICANELKVSDELLLANGTVVAITAIQVEKLDVSQATYNFEVDDFHTYYVSGSKILAHNKCYLDPKDIRYTQDSISNKFRDGSSVDDMIDSLKSGTLSPDDVPALEVFKQNGRIYSVNNRRLFAYKMAEIERVPVKWVSQNSMRHRLTGNGISIIVRGGSKFL